MKKISILLSLLLLVFVGNAQEMSPKFEKRIKLYMPFNPFPKAAFPSGSFSWNLANLSPSVSFRKANGNFREIGLSSLGSNVDYYTNSSWNDLFGTQNETIRSRWKNIAFYVESNYELLKIKRLHNLSFYLGAYAKMGIGGGKTVLMSDKATHMNSFSTNLDFGLVPRLQLPLSERILVDLNFPLPIYYAHLYHNAIYDINRTNYKQTHLSTDLFWNYNSMMRLGVSVKF
ncbi:hypothetical protein GC194_00745 [bacterium]|nr:hypothetical protein [bacterium]